MLKSNAGLNDALILVIYLGHHIIIFIFFCGSYNNSNSAIKYISTQYILNFLISLLIHYRQSSTSSLILHFCLLQYSYWSDIFVAMFSLRRFLQRFLSTGFVSRLPTILDTIRSGGSRSHKSLPLYHCFLSFDLPTW